MEFVLKTDLEKSLPAAIDFNFEQLKCQLENSLKKYKNLVVTKETVKDGKSKKSDLNRLKKALNSQRIAIKNKCMEPYAAFESKVKELTGMIDEAVDTIDKQVKEFDEIKRQEKRQEIESIYAANVGDLKKLLSLERLWNQRWLNVTYKITDIEKEIKQAVSKANNDIGIIKAMQVPCEVSMISVYIKTLDMSAALAEKTRHEELQKQIDKRQYVKEPAHNVESLAAKHEFPANNKPLQTQANPPEEPKTIKVIFYDTTVDFRHEMRALTEKYGVRYGGIR